MVFGQVIPGNERNVKSRAKNSQLVALSHNHFVRRILRPYERTRTSLRRERATLGGFSLLP